ncbi:MAG TPA: N-acyl homoserine lactonase family protein [Solirubrobacterales bacterium]|nr:N-acyl homoserine lactonase family protein [Solirubrobacterales bacterium]
MSHTVRSLRVGTLIIGSVETPVWAWLVRGGERTILVDAGTPPAAMVESRWKLECPRGGPEALEEELAACGVTFADIEVVVPTHLHYDHAWSLSLFEEAEVWTQHAEIVHAIDPTPTHRAWYPRNVISDLVARRRPDRLRILHGDATVEPGVDLLFTPGHTPGLMSVVVETEVGRVGLPSDGGETYANWHPADPRANARPQGFLVDSFLPPGISTESIGTCLASQARVREAADIVVPSHDLRIPIDMPEQWWDVPPETAGA